MKSFKTELFKNSLIISFLPIILLTIFFSLTCYQAIKKHITVELQKQFSIFSELFRKELTNLSDKNLKIKLKKLKDLLKTDILFLDCHQHFFTTDKSKKNLKEFLQKIQSYKIEKFIIVEGPNKEKFFIFKNKTEKCYQLIAIPLPSDKETISFIKGLFEFWLFLAIILTSFSFIYALYLSNYFDVSIKKLLVGINFFRKEGREPKINPIEIKELEILRRNILYMTKEIIKQQDEICENMSLFIGILNSTKSLIFVVNENNDQIIMANKEAILQLRCSSENLYNKKMSDIIPNWKEKDIAEIEGKQKIICTIYKTKAKLKGNNVSIITAQDITNILKLQKEISEERAKLNVILQTINDAVIAINKTGKIVFSNLAAKKILDIKDENIKEKKKIGDILFLKNKNGTIDISKLLKKICRTKETIFLDHDLKLITLTKKELSITCYLAPVIDDKQELLGIVIVIKDITKEKELEKKLLKQEKLRCLGIMASGIAHDFNNFIFHIKGNIDLLKHFIVNNKKAEKYLKRLECSLKMASELTQQLLILAREKPRIKKDINIKKIIEELIEVIISNRKIKIIKEIPENLWTIEGDEIQIKQALQNLIINAAEAMDNKGTIFIRCNNINEKDSKWIKIEVEDKGPGIPKDILSKIFDPFFTTKESGTGLGLAICHSVINAHDGKIEVSSKIGKGTKFTIYLPAKIITISKESYNKIDNNDKPKNNQYKKILILDDDKIICETLKEMLETKGYLVDYALKGEEIVTKYKKALSKGETFDLIIMDWHIKNGWGAMETLKELQKINPAIKVLITSGKSIHIEKDENLIGFLQKPYSIEDLASYLTS